MTHERIKIGQIGISHEHAAIKMRSLRELSEHFEIVGVVDDRASTAARRIDNDLSAFDGVERFSEEALLSLPGLQAVMIETANADLVPTAQRCAEREVAIHMDKPGGGGARALRRLGRRLRFDDEPLQLTVAVSDDTGVHPRTSRVIDVWIQQDRYRPQLMDFATMIRGESPIAYGAAHDRLVHRVLLAAAGYEEWMKP